MTQRTDISPDKALIARLHAACRPSLDARAIPLDAGKPGDMDHVLETPDNVARAAQTSPLGDKRPEEA